VRAQQEKRKTLAKLVRNVAQAIDIPFTVGGGINAVDDVAILLDNGADKVSINSAAVRRPELISEVANRFGTQCVVVAIDAKQIKNEWVVHLVGGRVPTERMLFEWAKEAVVRGAGELLFTSMDHDGTKQGFANEALQKLSRQVSVPIIASGGAGTMQHFIDTFVDGNADAALAASVFHFKEISIPELKNTLRQHQIPMR
jgi:cyclase